MSTSSLARGAAIRRARARRVSSIRRRVVAGALALFVAVWLLIAVVMATGHDPVLSRKATAVASGTGVSGASSGSSSQGSTSSGSGGSSQSSAASSSSSTGGLSSVTSSAS